MTCPRCSSEAPESAVDCPACGIVFSKWRARETPAPDAAADIEDIPAPPARWRPAPLKGQAPPAPPEFLGITHPGWRAAAIGLALALLLTWFPFLKFILSPLLTLVHEIGHTVVLWLFGYPAIPAFDFANGGGVTMSDLERSPSAVWAWAIGLAAVGWWQRENTKVLAALFGVAVVYFWMYNSDRETLAITLGGHGGEVVFGALFLYRGLTGWGCKIEAERPLYAFIAFMILFASIHLGWSLLGNGEEKFWYLQGKGGIDNDLVTGAQMLSWTLEGVARALVTISFLAIPAAFVAAAMRKTIGAVSEAEEEA